MAMVGSIAALAAPSAAAVTGSVTLNATHYTIGGTAKATILDADVNAAANRLESDVNIGGGSGLAAGASKTVVLTNTPLVGTPKAVVEDSSTSSLGGTAIAGLDIQVVSATLGIVNIVTSTARAANFEVDVEYKTSAADTLTVKFTSTQDSTGITVTATETGNDTGKFEVIINLVDAATTSSSVSLKNLKTLNLDTIKVEYTDTTPASGTSVKVSDTGSVETSKPTFSGLSPLNSFSTQSTQPTLAGTISDVGGAGIDVSEVRIFMDGSATVPTTLSGADGDTSVAFSHNFTLSVAAHVWYVQAKDMAGNIGRTDSNATTSGDQDYALSVDTSPPVISSVNTGKYWNTVPTTAIEASNRLSSLSVVFNEKLDSTTVAAADFLVEGVAPTLAEVHGTAGTTVYLTLGTDLAANAKPTVAISTGGSIADTAGNAINVGTKKAIDVIKPTFTVGTDVTLTKDKVVISVSSNEPIGGVPSVTIYNASAALDTTLTVVVKTSTSWDATYSKVGADGKKSVYVTASDLAATPNAGTKGKTDPATTGAIVFTLDTTAATRTFKSGTVDFTSSAANVEGSSPTISVAFNEKVAVTKAEFGLSTASSLTDILTTGTLSSDGKTWIYTPSGLTKDATYSVKISATDTAGNKLTDSTASFVSKAVALPSISLEPGQNLISFSGNPVDGAINTVFSSSEVTEVATYDSTAGVFLTAIRGADGLLSGSLATIDGQHAYFVKSSTFGTLKVAISKLGFTAAPNVTPVTKGWNMLAVTSVAGAAPGTTVTADSYLSTVKWASAYTYNPIPNTWVKTQPKNFANLTIGKGYWVYVTEDGILVP